MADTELVQINKGIKRLVKLIETSTIVDRTAITEMKKTREFQERERDEKGRFIKKEEEIQEKEADTAEKEAELLVSTSKQLKEKNKKDWASFKEQSRLYKLGQAFWKSEAGMALRNFFSRMKGVVSNILGEIGEFFSNIWATIKDSFQFVKGTFTSIIESFRGGPAKERREKEVARDVKDIKKVIKGEAKRGLLEAGKKKKKGSLLADILSFLGLGVFAGGVGIAGLITGLLKAIFFKWIPWIAIIKSLVTGIKKWLESGSFVEGLKAALNDLLTIPKWLIGTILGGVDLFFGTDLKRKFEEGWKDFEKQIDEMVDFLFVTIPAAFAAAWERLKNFDVVGAFEAFKATLSGGEYGKRTTGEALKDITEKEKKTQEAVAKGWGEQGGKSLRERLMAAGMSDEEILDYLAAEGRKTAEAEKQRQTQIEQLERIANAVEGGSAKPTDAPSFPNTTGIGQPTIAPNVNDQLQSITSGP